MAQVIKKEILEAIKSRPFYFIEGEKYYTHSLSGDIVIYDLGVSRELTIKDLEIRVTIDEEFRNEFFIFLSNHLEAAIASPEYQAYKRAQREEVEHTPINQPDPIPLQKIVYTYLMYDAATGLYKIGRSRDVQFREKTLGGQIPLIQTICSAPIDIEAQLHSKYSDCRKRGEWFDLPEQAVNDIRELLESKAA